MKVINRRDIRGGGGEKDQIYCLFKLLVRGIKWGTELQLKQAARSFYRFK